MDRRASRRKISAEAPPGSAPYSATPSVHIPGKSFYIRRSSDCGRPRETEKVCGSCRKKNELHQNTPSSVCVPVNLHAIAVQDKVFLEGQFVDPGYKARRENLFVAGGQLRAGWRHLLLRFDEHRTEGDFRLRSRPHRVAAGRAALFSGGSGDGAWRRGLVGCPASTSQRADKQNAERILDETTRHMGRRLDTRGIKELLYRNYEHPQWDNGERSAACLALTAPWFAPPVSVPRWKMLPT